VEQWDNINPACSYEFGSTRVRIMAERVTGHFYVDETRIPPYDSQLLIYFITGANERDVYIK
jgi:hypothetical protein